MMYLISAVILFVGRMLWVGAGIGAVLGGVQLALSTVATGAPQQAAAAAMAAASAVIPYVLARAWDQVFAPVEPGGGATPTS